MERNERVINTVVVTESYWESLRDEDEEPAGDDYGDELVDPWENEPGYQKFIDREIERMLDDRMREADNFTAQFIEYGVV